MTARSALEFQHADAGAHFAGWLVTLRARDVCALGSGWHCVLVWLGHLTGTIAVLPGGGCVAEPVPGPHTSTPSELFPLVASGEIGPTSVKPRPAGRAGGLAGLTTTPFPRMAAINSFCTSCATMLRSNVGGSISPQSWCTMSKYSLSPTIVMFSIAPIV